MQPSDGAIEWCLLQNQFDSYEKFALLIKLASVLILSSAMLLDRAGLLAGSILIILWLQDAIWKTFQARIEARLLKLEALLADNHLQATKADPPYQFNTDFLQSRRGGIHLVVEYLRQAVRPTVAFPHIALLGVLVFGLIS